MKTIRYVVAAVLCLMMGVGFAQGEVVGCMVTEACNYDPSATIACDGCCDFTSCLAIGCMNELACNYDPEAIIPDASCTLGNPPYDCDGECVNDTDGDGVCDVNETYGCTDSSACNYDDSATEDYGSCVYNDDCGVCYGDNSSCGGCTDEGACNYDPSEIIEDDSNCEYLSCAGCSDSTACNYNMDVTIDDGTCTVEDECGECGGAGIAEGDCDCDGNELDECDVCGGSGIAVGACDCAGNIIDECGVCGGGNNSCSGCMLPQACNFDENAVLDDGSCLLPLPGQDCVGADLCFGLNEIVTSANQIVEGDSVILTFNPAYDSVLYSFQLPGYPGSQVSIPLLSSFNNFRLKASGVMNYYSPVGNQSIFDPAFQANGGNPNYPWTSSSPSTFWAFNGGMLRPVPDEYRSNHVYYYDPGELSEEAEVSFIGGSGMTGYFNGNFNFQVISEDGIEILWSTGETTSSITVYPTESQEYTAVVSHGAVQCPVSTFIEVGYEGCLDHEACNFDDTILIENPMLCIYPEEHYNCDGECVCDSDSDGVCNGLEIIGCGDESACNFSSDVTESFNSMCIYPPEFYECEFETFLDTLSVDSTVIVTGFNFVCLNDLDGDEVCDELEVAGCLNIDACNFEPDATDHNPDLCVYPETNYLCDGNCISDFDEDGVCDELEVAGCENLTVDSLWTELSSGVYPQLSSTVVGVEKFHDFAFLLSQFSEDESTGQLFQNLQFEIDSIYNLPTWLTCSFSNYTIIPDTPICLECNSIPLESGAFFMEILGELTVSVLGQPISLGSYSYTFELVVEDNNGPILGCVYQFADNYSTVANTDDGSCLFLGCTNPEATNWHMFADLDDGSCVFEESSNNCIADLDYSGDVGATDLLLFLSAYGDTCE